MTRDTVCRIPTDVYQRIKKCKNGMRPKPTMISVVQMILEDWVDVREGRTTGKAVERKTKYTPGGVAISRRSVVVRKEGE